MVLESVLGVLVLYKRSLRESETFTSLSKALVGTSRRFDLLVYDNSPIADGEVEKIVCENLNITYRHDSSNPGLSKAYNLALEEGNANNKQWLLLLDQDTHITGELIKTVSEKANERADYVSIIPKIYSKEKLVSPTRYDFLGRMKPIGQDEINRVHENITAINSGACLAISFLNQINGFSEKFPLDMLDHWLYLEIKKRKEKVFVSSCNIQHKLSVSDFNTLSIGRYRNILKAEKTFYSIHSKKYLKYIFKARLLFRSILFLVSGRFNFMLANLKNIR